MPSRVFNRMGLSLLSALAAFPPRPVEAGDAGPCIVLHARLARLGAGTCSPAPVASCGEVEVTGFLESQVGPYFVYVMASGVDSAGGVQEIHTGVAYDWFSTVSGVDILQWSLCADVESPSPGWYQEGGSNRIRWNPENCGKGEFAVAGYFLVEAYSPDQLAMVPPAGGAATVTPCGGDPAPLPATALGIIGFGGMSGCNPCLDPCMYTPVEPMTWSRIKALHRNGNGP